MGSVLISFALFAIAMIIFFVVRASDQKTSGVRNVKILVEKLRSDIHSYDTTFKQDIAEVDLKIHQQQNEVRELVQNSAAQIMQLKNYSDDFSSLHGAMTGYQNSLTALARLTEDADAKMDQLKADVEELEKLRDTIENFRQELAAIHDDAVAQINDLHDRTLEEVRSLHDGAIAEFKNLHDSAVVEVTALHEESVADMRATAESATDVFSEKVESIKNSFDDDIGQRLEVFKSKADEVESSLNSKISQMEDDFKTFSDRMENDMRGTVSMLEGKASSIADTASESIQAVKTKFMEYQTTVKELQKPEKPEVDKTIPGFDAISSPEDIAALMDEMSSRNTTDSNYEVQDMSFDFSVENHT